MTGVTIPYEFVGGKKAIAKQVNANFEAILKGFAGFNVEFEQLKSEVVKFNNKPTRDSFDIVPSLLGKAPVGAYPLWTGEWIYNARTLFKEFWAKALEYKKAGTIRVLSTEDYDKEVKDYTETGSFVIDELNGHIRLPKITRFISGINELSELGKPANDSLQDHKHNFYQNKGVYAAGSRPFENLGPVSDTASGDSKKSTTGVFVDEDKTTRVGSETQPKHVKIALYIQIANNTAEISAFDTNVIVEQLNKAIAELDTAFSEKSTVLNTLATEKVNLLNQTATNDIGYIEDAGAEQLNTVKLEGKAQVDSVTAEGEMQVKRVIAAGDGLVASGTEQVGLVAAEGDKQTKRVQDIGANLQQLGDTQVERVQTVVAEEVDKKLPEITGKVDEIIAEGDAQILRVTDKGAEQVNLAKAQAEDAATSATVSEEFSQQAKNWAEVAENQIIPGQIGNVGKFLKTDGAALLWESIDLSNIKKIGYEAQREVTANGAVNLQLLNMDEIISIQVAGNTTINIDQSLLDAGGSHTFQLLFWFPSGAKTISFVAPTGQTLKYVNNFVPNFSNAKSHWVVLRKNNADFWLVSDAGTEG